ncbi:MAG: PDZ domain-containing protein [Elusimicrobia bacterium]|nr:PDZ domain-containing protein [Elusimicrobiota bacterium]
MGNRRSYLVVAAVVVAIPTTFAYAAPSVATPPSTAPEWVYIGSGPSPDGKALKGVGVVRGINSARLSKAAADERARQALDEVTGSVLQVLLEEHASAFPGRDLINFADGARYVLRPVLGMAAISQRWRSPDGIVYSLATIDINQAVSMLNSTSSSSGLESHLRSGARDFLAKNLRAATARVAEDPALFPPKSFDSLRADLYRHARVGIEVSDDSGPVVSRILPGNPPANVLRVGDRITAIDGTDTRGFSRAKVERCLRGQDGSEVRFAVARDGKVYDGFRVYRAATSYGVGERSPETPNPCHPAFGGVGMELRAGGYVQRVFDGLPADRAGIREDDVLATVDGKDVSRMTLPNVLGLLRGPPGTKVEVAVNRAGRIHRFTLSRQLMSVEDALTLTRIKSTRTDACRLEWDDPAGWIPGNLLGIPAGAVGFAGSLAICIPMDLLSAPFIIFNKEDRGEPLEGLLACHAFIPALSWYAGYRLGSRPILALRQRLTFKDCDVGIGLRGRIAWDGEGQASR